ncbi:hypothetical protein Q1695_009012 [Nippostrongylus brasiliensis]|nr:hypothetical protein Q1695_009012 [Nippostrongylus brasiliensis]
MAEFKSLDEEFADLLLDSDAELNGEPASEGVLLLENDDESDDDEERDEKENRVFRDADEMLKFLGICLYMGNVRLPTLRHYWSTRRMYTNLCPSIMARNSCHGAAKDEKGVPELIKDYNACMIFADTSDQMAAYYPFIRRTCEWYLRVFFHLILQTSLVNAWILYC